MKKYFTSCRKHKLKQIKNGVNYIVDINRL